MQKARQSLFPPTARLDGQSIANQEAQILTVKVGSSGAAWVADSATEELSSLSTFWSSALTPPTRKAALAAAAATLNFILQSRAASQTKVAAAEKKKKRRGAETSMDEGEGGNRRPRESQTMAMGMGNGVSLQLGEREKNHQTWLQGRGVVNLKFGRRAISDNVSSPEGRAPELPVLLRLTAGGVRGRIGGQTSGPCTPCRTSWNVPRSV